MGTNPWSSPLPVESAKHRVLKNYCIRRGRTNQMPQPKPDPKYPLSNTNDCEHPHSKEPFTEAYPGSGRHCTGLWHPIDTFMDSSQR